MASGALGDSELDLLSQWRGYGPSGGYAIGFDRKSLEQMTSVGFRKVIYKKREELKAIR